MNKTNQSINLGRINFKTPKSIKVSNNKSLGRNIKSISNINRSARLYDDKDTIHFLDMLISPSYIKKNIPYTKSKMVAVYGFTSHQRDASDYIRTLNHHYITKLIDIFQNGMGISVNNCDLKKTTTNTLLKNISIISKGIYNFKQIGDSLGYVDGSLCKMVDYVESNKSKMDFFASFGDKKRRLLTYEATSLVSDNVDYKKLRDFINNNNILDNKNIHEVEAQLRSMHARGKLSRDDLHGMSVLIHNCFLKKLRYLVDEYIQNNQEVCDKIYDVVTIAALNHRLDIIAYYDDIDNVSKEGLLYNIQNLSKDIATRVIIPSEYLNDTYNYTDDLLYKWHDYLKVNQTKLDVFHYVNAKNLSTDEKNKLIKNLLLKNSSGAVDIKNLDCFIKGNNLFDNKNIHQAERQLRTMYNDDCLSLEIMYGIHELIQTHFFRNSSKLGVDFFNKNNITILSSWNKPSKIRAEKITKMEIENKHYNNNERRVVGNQEIREPITFSEIRHMLRKYKNDTDGITRIFMDGDSIEFAAGIDKGQWIKQDKSTLRESV
ncbi:hypothetical protein [Providencia sneebia]|uniref:hypothetical protein n=1 Tax=Providencia sneebia TaxID=516075 RepID=UPI0012EA960B|nr:hypothetical protein [Providencia sneebia]